MNQQLKEAKQAIRSFMRAHYTDERLAVLLAQAQDGKFDYVSCCCFIGIATLQGGTVGQRHGWGHYKGACALPGAEAAERAAEMLGYIGHLRGDDLPERNARRSRRLISMVKAEMRRRERARGAGLSVVTSDADCSLLTE